MENIKNRNVMTEVIKPALSVKKRLPYYPSKNLLRRWETQQAFNLAAQAILAFDPNFPMSTIRAALGSAKSPDALSRAMRKCLPYNYFGLNLRKRR